MIDGATIIAVIIIYAIIPRIVFLSDECEICRFINLSNISASLLPIWIMVYTINVLMAIINYLPPIGALLLPFTIPMAVLLAVATAKLLEVLYIKVTTYICRS